MSVAVCVCVCVCWYVSVALMESDTGIELKEDETDVMVVT